MVSEVRAHDPSQPYDVEECGVVPEYVDEGPEVLHLLHGEHRALHHVLQHTLVQNHQARSVGFSRGGVC